MTITLPKSVKAPSAFCYQVRSVIRSLLCLFGSQLLTDPLKYSLEDDSWEAKACQHFIKVSRALLRCDAPELALTAYAELGVGHGASGSGFVQLEFEFKKTQLQDCLREIFYVGFAQLISWTSP
ncbi:hypothetical protein HFD88_005679 [Aspergillus terreus]|nr:hypothetical protein HFD88_005679 [Aspergillus terreus]